MYTEALIKNCYSFLFKSEANKYYAVYVFTSHVKILLTLQLYKYIILQHILRNSFYERERMIRQKD